MKQNNLLKNYLPEILAFLAFCIGTITVSFFHEPWFDEFQAWGIAKDSLYNILFVIPHMEGHPPLWHLIIKCFQQFTDNPELAIKIPNLLAMFLAVWLLLFKSPFPGKIKLLLPFTYFIFYQYSIVSRPYSLLVLGLFIAAMLYKDKDTHPFKFIGALAFLSFTSAYGMLLATAITLAWLMEISDKDDIRVFLKSFLKDKRFYAMLLLFFVCLGLAIEIFPNGDVPASTALKYMPFFSRIFYFYFGLPADAFAFNIINYHSFQSSNLFNFYFVLGGIFGLLVNMVLINIFKQIKHLCIFIIPYFSFITFCSLAYLNTHHIGILIFIVIFSFWCALSIEESALKKINKNNRIYIFMFFFIVGMQLYWVLSASIKEVYYPYSNSREVSNFIKRNNLKNYNLFATWVHREIFYDKNLHIIDIVSHKGPIFDSEIYYKMAIENTNIEWLPVIVNPYFGKNIFYNFNISYPSKLYNIHKVNSEEENAIEKEKMKLLEKPDILFGMARIESVWGDDFKIYGNYIQIKSIESGFIWKDKTYTNDLPIFVHKDLYEKMKDYR